MTLTGTYDFGVNTELDSVIVEAYERIGRQASDLSANDVQSAIRSLSYLCAEWANKGVNLWEVSLNNSALTQGQQSITLNSKNVEVFQVYRRTTSGGINTDIMLSAISRADYAGIPNKQQQSSPTQYYFERTITPTMYLWPTPDSSAYTLYYYTMNFTQDPGNPTNTLDVPQRWFDAMAAGMAVRLAVKWAPEKSGLLQGMADIAYQAAAAEDREKVPTVIKPSLLAGRYA
jgi:hypothetical protein